LQYHHHAGKNCRSISWRQEMVPLPRDWTSLLDDRHGHHHPTRQSAARGRPPLFRSIKGLHKHKHVVQAFMPVSFRGKQKWSSSLCLPSRPPLTILIEDFRSVSEYALATFVAKYRPSKLNPEREPSCERTTEVAAANG
jgi:hypothetical protein